MDTRDKISGGFDQWLEENKHHIATVHAIESKMETDTYIQALLRDAYVSGALQVTKMISERS